MSAGLEIFSSNMCDRDYPSSLGVTDRAGRYVRPVPSRDDAKRAGRQALSGLKGTLAQRIAGMLQRDPQLLSEMVELGLVRREWLDDPKAEQMSTAGPMEVAERWLERSVEQRPSLLSKLGLGAIQQLSSSSEGDQADGMPSRLAVAFTDIEGFTAFTAREGDEAASRLLADHYKEVGPVVRSRGGHISKRLGDGLLLTFPSPESAVLACLEMVDAQPKPLRLRAGVHVGDVVISRDDVIGHAKWRLGMAAYWLEIFCIVPESNDHRLP